VARPGLMAGARRRRTSRRRPARSGFGLSALLIGAGLALIAVWLGERQGIDAWSWLHGGTTPESRPAPVTPARPAEPPSPAALADQAPVERVVTAETPSPSRPEPPPPPPAPARLADPALALLSLWSPEALRGQPGDEVIRTIKPDHRPPRLKDIRLPAPPLLGGREDSIRRVKVAPGDKPVALTFDLCEQADDVTGYDRRIVNRLRDEDVRATFFAGGKWMRNHEDKTQQLMADPRFEIGNHGWTHGNLRVLTGERMREQIVWTQAEYHRLWRDLAGKAERHGLEEAFRAVPSQPRTLRFPYGTCSAESLRTVNTLGLAAIQWDVVSADAARGQTAEAMARHVLREVKPGSIVVFHANGRGNGTAAALPNILHGLRERGYRFVTVSELLDTGEPDAKPECYELRPGDNLRYDALFGEGTE